MSSNPDLPRVWVTGAGGLIGSHFLATSAAAPGKGRVTGLTRAQLDLTDPRAVEKRFREDRPAMVIHCAALSRSADCVTDPALARRINIAATLQLAQLCAGGRFVFFSTDLVFDGRSGNYDETAPVNPLGVYAETKVLAEAGLKSHPDALIIRTSLNGGTSPSGDRGFNEMLRQDWARGRATTLFTDEYRCPIAAEETARAVWELAAKAPPGIYHVAGTERLSRWQIGSLLAERWPQLHPSIQPSSLKDYAGPPRVPDASLNCARAQQFLTAPLPGFSAWLKARPQLLF